jgi:hypothetical protein
MNDNDRKVIEQMQLEIAELKQLLSKHIADGKQHKYGLIQNQVNIIPEECNIRMISN